MPNIFRRIKNWAKFQHYKDGKRKPEWIKVYRNLLDDINWHELPGDDAKLLINLWLLASEHGGCLPPIKEIAFRLRLPESKIKSMLSRLPHWIEDDASTLLADCYQDASLEENKKENKKEKKEEDSRHSDEETAYRVYVETAGSLSLPVGRLNPIRRSKLRARLKEHGLQGWLQALENLKQSPFCRGEGPRGWKADLDFLLSPQKFQRLLEGAYEGGAPPARKSRGVHELEKFENDEEFGNVIELRPEENGQRIYPQLSGPTNGRDRVCDTAHQIADVLPASLSKADWQDSS